jgi:hypothetical protein
MESFQCKFLDVIKFRENNEVIKTLSLSAHKLNRTHHQLIKIKLHQKLSKIGMNLYQVIDGQF